MQSTITASRLTLLAILAVSFVSLWICPTHAADIEFLDVELQIVDFTRIQAGDSGMMYHGIRADDSDLLVYHIDISNNGAYTVGFLDYTIYLAIEHDKDDIEYYGEINTDRCTPNTQPPVQPRLTETWRVCFVVPAGMEPEFMGIRGDNNSHIVQFDASQDDQCVDFFKDNLCADYALDGKPVELPTSDERLARLQAEATPELIVYGIVTLAILIGSPIFVVWYLLRRRKSRKSGSKPPND